MCLRINPDINITQQAGMSTDSVSIVMLNKKDGSIFIDSKKVSSQPNEDASSNEKAPVQTDTKPQADTTPPAEYKTEQNVQINKPETNQSADTTKVEAPADNSIPVKQNKENYTPKAWNSYTVQNKDSLRGIIIRGLESRNIKNPSEEIIQSAIEAFKKKNPGAVKTKGKLEYLLVGTRVLVDGNLKDLNNSSEAIKQWEESSKTAARRTSTQKNPIKRPPNPGNNLTMKDLRPTFNKEIFYCDKTKRHYRIVNGEIKEVKGRYGERIIYVGRNGSAIGKIEYPNKTYAKTEYNDNHKLVKETHYSDKHKPTLQITNSYNYKGKLASSDSIDYTNNQRLRTSYYFNGKPLQETLLDKNGRLISTTSYNRDNSFRVSYANGKLDMYYDTQGRVTKEDSPFCKTTYTYLPNGRCIAKFESEKDTPKISYCMCDGNRNKLYQCNASGKRIQTNFKA